MGDPHQQISAKEGDGIRKQGHRRHKSTGKAPQLYYAVDDDTKHRRNECPNAHGEGKGHNGENENDEIEDTMGSFVPFENEIKTAYRRKKQKRRKLGRI